MTDKIPAERRGDAVSRRFLFVFVVAALPLNLIWHRLKQRLQIF